MSCLVWPVWPVCPGDRWFIYGSMLRTQLKESRNGWSRLWRWLKNDSEVSSLMNVLGIQIRILKSLKFSISQRSLSPDAELNFCREKLNNYIPGNSNQAPLTIPLEKEHYLNTIAIIIIITIIIIINHCFSDVHQVPLDILSYFVNKKKERK